MSQEWGKIKPGKRNMETFFSIYEACLEERAQGKSCESKLKDRKSANVGASGAKKTRKSLAGGDL